MPPLNNAFTTRDAFYTVCGQKNDITMTSLEDQEQRSFESAMFNASIQSKEKFDRYGSEFVVHRCPQCNLPILLENFCKIG